MKYNQKSDIWSLGVSLYEIIGMKYPFIDKPNEKTQEHLINFIYKCDFDYLEDRPEDINFIISQMLKTHADHRISLDEACKILTDKEHFEDVSGTFSKA